MSILVDKGFVLAIKIIFNDVTDRMWLAASVFTVLTLSICFDLASSYDNQQGISPSGLVANAKQEPLHVHCPGLLKIWSKKAFGRECLPRKGKYQLFP